MYIVLLLVDTASFSRYPEIAIVASHTIVHTDFNAKMLRWREGRIRGVKKRRRRWRFGFCDAAYAPEFSDVEEDERCEEETTGYVRG
jgi:hypothetical protein